MKIRLWGTRGSLPVGPQNHDRYGCMSTCIEVLTDAGDCIILDAGTGMRELGNEIVARHTANASAADNIKPPIIFFTHMHHDHVRGLPHFNPNYDHSQPLTMYGPKPDHGDSFADTIKAAFDGVSFPVKWESMPAHSLHEIHAGDEFRIGSALIRTCPTHHPGGCLAYRIEADGWSFVFTGDHEIASKFPNINDPMSLNLFDFLAGADLVLADSQYSEEDFNRHLSWGHSYFEQWPEPLAARGVKRLFFTHYNPDYDDDMLDAFIADTQQNFRHLPIIIEGAREGTTLLQDSTIPREPKPVCEICDLFQQISSLSDSHTVLSAILHKARQISQADAGTIYLVEDGELVFSAAHNDTLFPRSAASKYTYLNSRLTINQASIAGYVASTGEYLNLPDVYEIPADKPYGFNISYDRISGYRTGSVLALPLVNSRGTLLGVLQLINCMDDEGNIDTFTPTMQAQIARLTAMATIPLEQSFMTLDMIMRMLKTSALRDPNETASHVQRVGSMAAELYHRWAEIHDIDPEELLVTKGQLRLAAMLHDVGKVGIPDAVLKKPGRLDADERAIMLTHAAQGASLFENPSQEIDKMAWIIAMHHHQKWNGTGYTGSPIHPLLSGQDIPLWARITAIADVYDALVSHRCYKEPWLAAKALATIQNEAGSHFDPELVDLFMQIQETVEAIYTRFE